jgi:hypothetical protein
MPMIESYHTVVVPDSEEAATAPRRSLFDPATGRTGPRLHSAKGR